MDNIEVFEINAVRELKEAIDRFENATGQQITEIKIKLNTNNSGPVIRDVYIEHEKDVPTIPLNPFHSQK